MLVLFANTCKDKFKLCCDSTKKLRESKYYKVSNKQHVGTPQDIYQVNANEVAKNIFDIKTSCFKQEKT